MKRGVGMTKANNIRSSLYLSLTALIWGVAFVFQSMGNAYMGPFTFTASRYLLGCLTLLPVIAVKCACPRFLADPGEIPVKKAPVKLTVAGGILCGLALCAASLFQQYGVKLTTVGKAGFITTLYIIITPVIGLLLGRKCHFTVWIGAAAAVVGLYLLCITDGFTLSWGDSLVMICAVLFSVHILLVDHFAPKTNGVLLACIQFFVSGVTAGVLALLFETPSLSQIRDGLIPVLYTGVMSSGVAYTLQILGQRDCNPTVAAMIMSLESVISAVAAYIAYALGFLTQDQSMTAVQILGCVIMLSAVIFVQLPFDKLSPNRKAP